MLQTRLAAGAAGLDMDGAIPAPGMHTLSQWVQALSCRADLLSGRAAATTPAAQQVHELWTKAIAEQEPQLVRPACRALARQARAADRLISQWLAAPDEDSGYPPPFLRWRRAVKQVMQDNNWFAPEDWLRHFHAQIRKGAVDGLLPVSIVLSGFPEMTRLEQAVIEALERAGVRIGYEDRPERSRGRISVRHFASFEHELTSMAQWAFGKMAAGKNRIAVIVNDLDVIGDRVRRVFEDTFHPGRVLGLAGFADADFHLSSKPVMASLPLVQQALELLGASVSGARRPLEFPAVSRLLLAPNWTGAEAERLSRAALELHLREKRRYRISLAGLADLASKLPPHASPPLLIRLCGTLAPADPAQAPARQLLAWLEHWGWPGEQALDTVSTEAVQRFLQALESLSRQPFTDAAGCLQSLRELCGDTAINLHGGAFSPVQVMSPAEAFGQRFDDAWVGNLGESNWPGRTIDNAFIPARQQAGIPRATDAGMLAYTERLMRDLAGCAGTVVFSGANRFEDIPQAVSPLLSELDTARRQVEMANVEQPPRAGTLLSLSSAPRAAEITGYAEHPWLRAQTASAGLPLSEAEAGALHGAVRRFNYQSACPLAAYLVFRLDARMEDPPGPFVDAAFRGRLLHAALQHLYRPMLESGEAPGAGDVQQAVAQALRDEYAETRLMPASLEAERIRLQRLLRAWLAQDQVRLTGQPLELEWKSHLSFSGFEFRVRIDRLDRVGENGVLILDYKSGGVGYPAWGRERLEDVQLPLYAVALAETGEARPVGVALLQLKPGDIRAFGITGDNRAACDGVQVAGRGRGALARRFDDWEQVLSFWRGELGELAEEIRAGDCSHRLYNEKALRYAGLEILLRSAELGRWLADHAPGAQPDMRERG